MNLQQILPHDYCYMATLFDFSPLQKQCALRYDFTVIGVHIEDEDKCSRNFNHLSPAFGLHHHRFHHTLKVFVFIGKNLFEYSTNQWVCILYFLEFIHLK